MFSLIVIVMHSYSMQIWPVYLDSITFKANEQFVVADFRSKGDFVQDQVNDYFLIWNEGDVYSTGNMTGNNFYNNGEEFLSLIMGNFGWAGAGFHLNIPVSLTQMQALKDAIVARSKNYWLHFAIKSTTTGSHAFELFNNTAGFTIGTNQVDQRRIIGDFQRDGEWHEFYIPMSNYINDIATMVLSQQQNENFIFNFRTDGSSGLELDLDAIYFCDEEMKEYEPINHKCGDDIVWNIANDTLFLIGSGSTFDYSDEEKTPWAYFAKNIHVITLSDGITTIGTNVFKDCSNFKSIILPNTITTIKNGAFHGCRNLSSIIIPNSVTSLGDKVFDMCVNLTTVTIGNSVTSIGENAFNGCENLTTVTIGNNVTSIGNGAFMMCKSLPSINIPNSVTSIGSHAFQWCRSLATVTIGNNVTTIGGSAFQECGSLATINLPNGITNIEGNTFMGCRSLTTINIPNSVTNIGGSAFEGCRSLTTINIPNSVTNIGGSAFEGCRSLTTINIPNSVTIIWGATFKDCSGLTSITIPESVELVSAFDKKSAAFGGCTMLESVIWNAKSCYILDNVCSPFEGATNNIKSFTLGAEVEKIPSYVCDGMNQLTSIVIPNKVTLVEKCAFRGCENLSSISIGSNVVRIEEKAFDSCSKLKEIIFPNKTQYIGKRAFANCSKLETLTFGKDLEIIEDSAFADCKKILDIYSYAEEVPEITAKTFQNVSRYAYVHVPSDMLHRYQIDEYWNDFILKTMGANTVPTDGGVLIQPGDNDVIITWPTSDNAASYSLTITKDGVVFCVLTFNAQGQLIGIAFAPAKDGNAHAPMAILTEQGYQFKVTGLEAGTSYAYQINVTDSQNMVLASYEGTFSTNGYEAFDNIESKENISNKILRNGQIFILRGDKTYTLQGQEIL